MIELNLLEVGLERGFDGLGVKSERRDEEG